MSVGHVLGEAEVLAPRGAEETCQKGAICLLQGRLADLEAPLIVRIFRGIWRMFFGRGGSGNRGKTDAEKKGAAKSGPKEEPLAEERAAFMTPGQRRASREADAE